jgi:hypothetical protein
MPRFTSTCASKGSNPVVRASRFTWIFATGAICHRWDGRDRGLRWGESGEKDTGELAGVREKPLAHYIMPQLPDYAAVA